MGRFLLESGGALLTEAAGSLMPEGAPAVTATWTGSYAIPSGFFFPFPSARPLQVPVTNTAGDWLFALVAWRPSTAGSGAPSIVVADDAHNWWEPVGAPSTDSSATGVVRTALWAAPAARVANSLTGVTNVQVAATGPVLSLACVIADVAGIVPWYQVAAVSTNFFNTASALTVSTSAPSAQAILFSGFATDNNSMTVTGPSGWTALPGASASNGVDHTADIALDASWQVTSSAATANVSIGGALDLAGVIAGVLVSAPQPAQPSPNWPVVYTEMAIGAGIQTPPAQMTWTSLAARSTAFQMRQGKPYSLGQLQAGQGTIEIDNPDGALIPPGTGPFAGLDSGTPLRRRIIWPGLAGAPNLTPHYVAFSGYFRRWPFTVDAELLRGKTTAEITDAWGYGNGPLTSMAIGECLIDSPHSLWPMTDPAGSAGASNVVPNGIPLTLVTSKYGAGGASITWGTNSGALAGMSSATVTANGKSGGSTGMWQQKLSGASLNTQGYGYALVCQDAAFPGLTGNGCTVEAWAGLSGYTVGQGFGNSGSTITCVGLSGVANGTPVVFTSVTGFTLPAPITAGTVYYVIAASGTTFQVSATPGGSAVTLTTSGSGLLSTTQPWDMVIMALRDVRGTAAGLSVRHTDGALLLPWRAASGATGTVTVDTARDYRVTDGGGVLHFSLSVAGTAWRVLVNGGGGGTFAGSFPSTLPATFRELCFGGVIDAYAQTGVWNVTMVLAGIFPGVSPQQRVINRQQAARGLVGEAACDRIERLLEYAGMAGRRWLGQQSVTGEGDLCASGQNTGGQAAVSSMNSIAASTLPAMLSLAPTGDVVYHSKLYCWNEPVKWTLGDNTAGGEIPFAVGQMATDYDPARVAANVQITQLDTQTVTVPTGVMSATTMPAVAAAAAGQYGGQPYQNTGYLWLDWSSPYNAGGGLVDLANWVQAIYARPQNRVQAVTVDAASHPQAWPFWGGAAPGDMAAVNVRLPTAAASPLITMIARITQVTRQMQYGQGATSATISVALDFAPEYRALVCDDAVRGLLNGVNVLAWLRRADLPPRTAHLVAQRPDHPAPAARRCHQRRRVPHAEAVPRRAVHFGHHLEQQHRQPGPAQRRAGRLVERPPHPVRPVLGSRPGLVPLQGHGGVRADVRHDSLPARLRIPGDNGRHRMGACPGRHRHVARRRHRHPGGAVHGPRPDDRRRDAERLRRLGGGDGPSGVRRVAAPRHGRPGADGVRPVGSHRRRDVAALAAAARGPDTYHQRVAERQRPRRHQVPHQPASAESGLHAGHRVDAREHAHRAVCPAVRHAGPRQLRVLERRHVHLHGADRGRVHRGGVMELGRHHQRRLNRPRDGMRRHGQRRHPCLRRHRRLPADRNRLPRRRHLRETAAAEYRRHGAAGRLAGHRRGPRLQHEQRPPDQVHHALGRPVMTGIVPAVPQIPAGWGPLPADFTTWVTTPFTFLASKVMFRAEMHAAVPLSASAFTIIPLDAILEDPYSGWSAGAHQWNVPAGCGGYYEATLTAATVSQGAPPTSVGAAVWVDGAQYAQVSLAPGVDGNTSSASGTVLLPLSAGDYVQFYVFSTAAVNSSTTAGRYPAMELAWISS